MSGNEGERRAEIDRIIGAIVVACGQRPTDAEGCAMQRKLVEAMASRRYRVAGEDPVAEDESVRPNQPTRLQTHDSAPDSPPTLACYLIGV